MDIKINTRDAALVIGGLAAGFIAGSILIKHAKKEIKKEIVNEHTKALKNEIKQEIKESIDVKGITKEIKQQIEDSIIDDTLESMLNKNAEFMAKVDIRLDKYEKRLNEMSEEVMDFDARVGKMVNGAVKTIAGVVARRGDDDED